VPNDTTPPKPKANGNAFENYVVASVSPKVFQSTITLGNIITMAGLIVWGSLLYAKVCQHLDNADIHQDRQAREQFIDERLALKLSTSDYRLKKVEEAVRDASDQASVAAARAARIQAMIDDKSGVLDRKLNRLLQSYPAAPRPRSED